MDIQTTKFQEYWDDFVLSFQGLLITESKKQELSFSLVKQALSEVIITWCSEYTINGKWLYNLMQDEPEKGKLVKEIITKDITLYEVKNENSYFKTIQYVVPVGSGIIGYSIASSLAASTIATVCATLLPMLVTYPICKGHYIIRQNKQKDIIIEGYIRQLNKYKESIMSVLLV